MNTENIIQQYLRICKSLEAYGVDGNAGGCLDLALGGALALSLHNIPVEVVLILREDDLVDNEEILSHAVLRIGTDYIDTNGKNAIAMWEQTFNENRRANGETPVVFYHESHTTDFNELYHHCKQRFHMNTPQHDALWTMLTELYAYLCKR